MNVNQGIVPMAPSNAETAGAQATSLRSGSATAPQPSAERRKVRFPSGNTTCAAWHYPGTNGACVIMAGGLAVTKEPGTDLFAKRFNDAGFAVLAFDYRHLGESGGQPRQIARIGEQHADWQAAIAFARTLPGVDARRLAIWGFSASGGHIIPVAARNPDLAAAIAQTPLVDGPAVTPNAMRHQTPLGFLRFTGRALLDAAGGLVGRAPLLMPLAGEPRDRHLPHVARRPQRQSGAQSRRQVPRLAAGGRRPLRAARRLVPARPPRVARAVPPAGARLRR